MELRSDTGVLSHWKDYEALVVFVFLQHKDRALFFVTDDEYVIVPMVPQIGVFRHGRVHELNCTAVELLLKVRI